MPRTMFTKRILLIAQVLLLALMADLQAEESSEVDYPQGGFHFDLGRLGSDKASQIRTLKSIGYSGLVLDLAKSQGLRSLKRSLG